MKVGNDIVEVKRFLGLVANKRFLYRVFNEKEQAHIFELKEKQKQAERMAGKFAAKESVAKALGMGISGGVNFLSIVVLPNDMGAPKVALFDEALNIFKKSGNKEIEISISNTSEYATCVCVIN